MFKKLFYFFVLSIVCLGNMVAQPTNNLVARYDFEDNIEDGVGDSDGLAFGNPTYSCGVKGQAIEFDGLDDFVIFFGNINNAIQGNDFTISLYIKPKVTVQAQGLLSKADSCAGQRFLGVRISTVQKFVETKLKDPTGQQILKANLNKRCWHHIVITRTEQYLTTYVDGVLANRQNTTSTLNIGSSAPLTLAEHVCLDNSLVRYQGLVDEMLVYNRALSPTEVADFYKPVDKIATRDTVVYVGTSFQAHITPTCANNFVWRSNDNTNLAYLTGTTIPNPVITLPSDTTYTYYLDITHSTGCRTTDTLNVSVVDPSKVGCQQALLPKAFTPNGDNLNDYYFISNPYAIEKLFSFDIYDRWGGRIFHTEDKFEQWDGKSGNQVLNNGSFVYKLEYECGGKRELLTGSLTLIR